MKIFLKILFLLSFTTVISTSMYSQSVHEILMKRNQMVREPKKLGALVGTALYDLMIETPQGSLPAKLLIKDGVGYRLEVLSKTNNQFEILNHTGYYFFNMPEKIKNIDEKNSEAYEFRKSLMYLDEFKQSTDVASNHMMPEYRGTEDVNGLPCHVFVVRSKNPEDRTEFFVDMVTFNVIKKVCIYSDKGEMKEEVYTYSNFKKLADGKIYPAEFTTRFGKAKVVAVKLDVPINEAEFLNIPEAK